MGMLSCLESLTTVRFPAFLMSKKKRPEEIVKAEEWRQVYLSERAFTISGGRT